MPSDIEIVGLVLAIIPFAIAFLEHHKKLLAPFKVLLDYRQRIEILDQQRELQDLKLLNTLERILRVAMPGPYTALLLRRSNEAIWQDPDLVPIFKDVLGRSYLPFEKAVQQYRDARSGLPDYLDVLRGRFRISCEAMQLAWMHSKQMQHVRSLERSNALMTALATEAIALVKHMPIHDLELQSPALKLSQMHRNAVKGLSSSDNGFTSDPRCQLPPLRQNVIPLATLQADRDPTFLFNDHCKPKTSSAETVSASHCHYSTSKATRCSDRFRNSVETSENSLAFKASCRLDVLSSLDHIVRVAHKGSKSLFEISVREVDGQPLVDYEMQRFAIDARLFACMLHHIGGVMRSMPVTRTCVAFGTLRAILAACRSVFIQVPSSSMSVFPSQEMKRRYVTKIPVITIFEGGQHDLGMESIKNLKGVVTQFAQILTLLASTVDVKTGRSTRPAERDQVESMLTEMFANAPQIFRRYEIEAMQ